MDEIASKHFEYKDVQKAVADLTATLQPRNAAEWQILIDNIKSMKRVYTSNISKILKECSHEMRQQAK